MSQLEIFAQPRDILGKKVNHLRQQGLIPGNVYGHGINSYAIQVEAKQLAQVLSAAGTSRLIGLRLPSEPSARQVLARHVSQNPVTHQIMHVDFYQVKMSEKLKAMVHLAYVGEAPAAGGGQGLLLRSMDNLEVECLPGNLPEAIQVDLSGLKEVGDALHVRDLSVPAGVTVLTPADELVAKVASARVEEEEVVAAPPAERPEAAAAEVAEAELEEREEAA